MMFWKKACDCEGGGVQFSSPHLVCNEKESALNFSFTIVALECSFCGKAYEHVEKPREKQDGD